MREPENRPKSYDTQKTLDLRPLEGEMIKPAELIDIQGGAGLSLGARRVYNKLLANAFGPMLANPEQDFEISLSELRGAHDSNDRLGEYIEALMKTIVTITDVDGSKERVQLLAWNNMSGSKREHGTLKYSFDKHLGPMLRNSVVFAKLELAVLQGFTTKYGLALYEALSRRVRLAYVFSEEFDVEDFREVLGVPAGKLASYGNLKQKAIDPAIAEIRQLAPFNCAVEPSERAGRKVKKVKLTWWMKSEAELREAYSSQNPIVLQSVMELTERLRD